ncbi:MULTISPECIES: xanthine dehydrogenase family protein molybdopterin-binding subunit [Pseudomonas]|uniref:xanthine dehydrogenase family protein molybdopterin-binding subunit n=1 Tax=Pseudomonas TaxID=286 RepID=UPI001BE99DD8|nr:MULTISPECIES: molybdopterin cofactor-binding domain-containing protein [Pseudomonas]MBT2339851.1 xanthine dehydrogenase family protein molybdopterin-binding subunit [Pseudomonas fluorescens]MCD4530367.1 molybdopterin-dependent oxidoreductase [Pseudomonas sp. C3-2018]
MNARAEVDHSRRAFLRGGALLVAFTLVPAARKAWADTEVDTLGTVVLAPDLPGSLRTNPYLDAWIRVSAEGITVYTGKVELGTGVRTALLQIAAERLDVSPSAINLLTADTALSPNEGYTAGSHSIFDSGTALFNAAAQVRQLLLESAARSWNTTPALLTTRDGMIEGPGDRHMSYADAVKNVDLHLYAKAESPVLPPAQFKLIGQSVPRLDIPAKVSGGAAFVQDIRLPGMLHARVIRPPRPGCRLEAFDEAKVQSLPGVVQVIRDGHYLAVVARDEWQAIKAMRSGYESAQWSAGQAIPASKDMHALLKKLPARRYPISAQGTPGIATGKRYQARVTKQYLMHGSIGPSCAVAWFKDGTLTVWTHTQGVYPLRAGIAEMLHLPLERVRCIHVEGSGCYGHNGADDAAADAALIALRMPGTPIRVQWMREQENLWEPYSSAMVTEVQANLDGQNRLQDWAYELWTTPHNERIVNAGRLLPARLLARPFVSAPSVPIAQPEGDGDRNAVPLYALASTRINMNFVTEMPFRTSAMRSLGAHINIFAIEACIDELASQAGTDPVAMRLAHLTDPRARAVVERVRDAIGWPRKSSEPGSGIGFAFARYKNIMGYCALAVRLQVHPQTGEVQIEQVVTAVDVGQIVNPDGLRNQVEGGILQSTSWTLYEQVAYDAGGIRSYDWSGYPILRFSQVPKQVDVHLLDQPGQPFLGAAEIVQGPMVAAIGNAVANATGRRWLNLPLMRSQQPS